MDGRVRLEVRRDESVRCVERRKNGERGEGEKGRLRVSFFFCCSDDRESEG